MCSSSSSSSYSKLLLSPHRACCSPESTTTWGQEMRTHLKNLDLFTMNLTSCALGPLKLG